MFDRLFRGGRGGRGQGGGSLGLRGGNKPGSGPGGYCVCPKCGCREPHQIGRQCRDIARPQCGTRLVKE